MFEYSESEYVCYELHPLYAFSPNICFSKFSGFRIRFNKLLAKGFFVSYFCREV